MDYGRNYSIYELARATELYLSLIDKVNLRFFIQDNLPFNRGEIIKSVQIGRQIKLQEKVPIRSQSHPAIHSAITNQEFYKGKVNTLGKEDKKFYATVLYTELVWLVNSMIGLITDVYIKTIEIKIADKENIEAIKLMTIEKQKHEYYQTHPSKFIEKYREYLIKRIKDYKELIEIDKLDISSEMKEILRSYKLGLEVNINGRNLSTPLLERNYKLFSDNLRNTLLTPSFYDVYKNERERFYHIYLLGVLEGRLNFYKIFSNKESGFGRYDICGIPLIKTNSGFIIEVKSDNSVSDDEAIQQIYQNEYLTELKNEGVKEVLILAINFQEKDIIIKYEIAKL